LYSYEELSNYELNTSVWNKREGVVIGNGENFLSIGRFVNSTQNAILSNCPSPDIAGMSAYNLIDDIFMSEIIDLPDAIYLCEGDNYLLELNVNNSYFRYLLNNIVINSSVLIYDEGEYILEIEFDHFSVFDTLQVIKLDENVDFLNYSSICTGTELNINEIINRELVDSVYVDGELAGNSVSEGIYNFSIYTECGIQHEVLEVIGFNCDCNIYIPNVFSPNFDGINDVFKPEYYCENSSIIWLEFEIYNRWGGLVYKDEVLQNIGWHGFSNNGDKLGSGVYIYVLKYKTFKDGIEEKISKNGYVNVLH
jgi:gliding motility-associated-like protein